MPTGGLFGELWKYNKENKVGILMSTFMENNKDRLDHKFSNLIDKMKFPTAMSQVSLEPDTQYLDLTETLGDATFDGPLHAELQKPFLLATLPHFWSWDFHSYPLPGLAHILHCVTGHLMVLVFKLDNLEGLPSVSSFHTFIESTCMNTNKKIEPSFQRSLVAGEGVCIPFGYLPVVVGFTVGGESAEEHCKALIHSVCTDKCTAGAAKDTKAAMRAFLDQEVTKHASQKPWSACKDAIKKWQDTALVSV